MAGRSIWWAVERRRRCAHASAAPSRRTRNSRRGMGSYQQRSTRTILSADKCGSCAFARRIKAIDRLRRDACARAGSSLRSRLRLTRAGRELRPQQTRSFSPETDDTVRVHQTPRSHEHLQRARQTHDASALGLFGLSCFELSIAAPESLDLFTHRARRRAAPRTPGAWCGSIRS